MSNLVVKRENKLYGKKAGQPNANETDQKGRDRNAKSRRHGRKAT
jgi:hypothetical protein